ncbi:hypothetical protein [Acinetobacter baumannii]|uniref:hypothetical protein n=1 Tax=Acinetobacter baumannii TaxID=470 RepID=UPI003F4C0CCE
MSLYTTGHPVVDKIASLNISKAMKSFPANWFKNFQIRKMESPIHNAVILLSVNCLSAPSDYCP